MKNKTIFRQAFFVLFCILINYGGKLLADFLSLPVWLDAIGTVFGAYYLGPVCGAAIGATSTIMYSFLDSNAIFYIVTNILTGIAVGISAKKGFLKDVFGIFSTAFVVTLVSVIVSTPLNFLISDGTTGNMWSDGIISLLQSLGTNRILSCVLGEYCVDYLDKTLAMLLLFAVVKIKDSNFIRKTKQK